MAGDSEVAAAGSCSASLTPDGIEGALQALCLFDVQAALAAFQTMKSTETVLTDAEAALDLVALFFPPASTPKTF